MSRYWCAILFVALAIDQCPGQQMPQGPVSARAQYQQAADFIGQSKHAQAIEPLRELVDHYPEHELANLAAFHLAECYLVCGDTRRALKSLDRFRPMDDRQSANASRLRRQAIQVAANQSIRAGQLAEAMVWFEKAMTLVSDPNDLRTLNQAFVRVGLAHCRKEIQSGVDVAKALGQIPTQHSSASENLAAIRFGIAETLYRSGKPRAALELYDALAATVVQNPGDANQEWMPSVFLRRAEIAMRQRDYAMATHIAKDAEARFPDFKSLHEFAFIRAQCDISSIQFQSALERLNGLLSLESAPGAVRRRAAWMVGEVYFLQKKYPEAMQAYRQATDLAAEAGEPQCVWNRRALLQSAKCLELVGQPEEAQSLYREIASEFKDCSESKFANARVATLQQLQETIQR